LFIKRIITEEWCLINPDQTAPANPAAASISPRIESGSRILGEAASEDPLSLPCQAARKTGLINSSKHAIGTFFAFIRQSPF
jgi:hypothetical protein